MLKKRYPKISIVTPSFNQGAFIEQTIKSVLDQGYPNLEYIIIDGGSTDNTLDILKKYDDKIDYWVSEPDYGQSDAINKGFSKATGDIFYWINSDDYLLFNALNTISKIDWSEGVGAVVGRGHKVNLNNKIVYSPAYYSPITTESLFKWTVNKNFMQPACFFSKESWEMCGPLNKDLHFCLDVDLWIKISKKFKFKRIKNNIAHAYIHEDAKTTAEVEKMKMETYLMIASHGGLLLARTLLFDFYADEKNKSNDLKNYRFSTLTMYLIKKFILRVKLLNS